MDHDAGGHGPVRCRRRRRCSGIALATATATILVAGRNGPFTTLAFSSSSLSSLVVPPSSRRVDASSSDGGNFDPTSGGGRRRPSYCEALGMVSYLEQASVVDSRPSSMPRKRIKKKSPPSPSSLSSSSTVVAKIGSVEIERRASLGDEAGSATPMIDFEILYEGITSAPPPPPPMTTTASSSAEVPVPPPPADITSNANGESPPLLPGVGRNIATKTTRGKSSTMPGFIKDENVDERLLDGKRRRGVVVGPYHQQRVSPPPSSALQRRPTARMVRPNASGTDKSIAKLKRSVRRRQANSESMYRNSATVPDSLLDYARDFHAVSRVTPREEVELGTRTQEAERLRRLHVVLQSRYGRDPTDDEWCAAAGKVNALALREAIEDGLEAKNQLVASNLRMVQRVVNLYIRNGLGSEYNAGDLMQDGTMALIRAAEKYEPDRGFRFSTYAMYWIRSAVKRSQTTQSRIVTVPQRIHETHKRVAKEEARLRKELGRDPTKAELANACDITVLQLRRCRTAMGQVTYSLDAEVRNTLKPNSGNSRKDTMHDIVEGTVDESEFERTQRLLMKEHLIGTIRRYLLPHEVDLLLLRYGLMDERALPKGMSGPLTIAEVSDLVGLKPDKVRRIIINSQKQLRHLMKEWEDFDCELG